jgi:hypothetical protein
MSLYLKFKSEVELSVDHVLDNANGNPEQSSGVLEQFAALKEIQKDIEKSTESLTRAMDSLKPEVKKYMKSEREAGNTDQITALGFAFNLRESSRISVDSWMADRVKAGESITGISLKKVKALYVTEIKQKE